MHIPPNWDPPKLKGKDKPDNVLKLRKNLYGSGKAARNWWLFLRKGLLERGFHQSKLDPCLFLRDDCLLFCYVDDIDHMSHIHLLRELYSPDKLTERTR